MQDNYPNIDKKFTDKGWAAMRDLLEEELPTVPTTRKGRGLIFLLLSIGIGVGITIGLVASVLYFKYKKPQQTKNVLVQPIAKEEAINVNQNINQNIKGTTTDVEMTMNPAKIENQDRVAEKLAGENVAISKTIKQNNKGGFTSNTSKNTPFEKEQMLSNSLNQKFNNFKNLIELSGKREMEIAENINQLIKKGGKQKIDFFKGEKTEYSLINNLNRNQLEEFEIACMPPNFEINSLIVEEKKNDKIAVEKELRKGLFGITSDFQGANNFVGIAAGFVYVKPIHNKWSLQAGVNYAYQRRRFEGKLIQIDSDDLSVGLPTTNLEDNPLENVYFSNSARSNSAIFTIPQNLNTHYLNIPIRVNYYIHEKWSIGGGVTGSVLLFATNNYTDGGLFNKSSDSFANNFEIESLQGTLNQESINKANLLNYDVAATLGIAFHPSPKWSITANYHHGFKNLFKYSSDKEYNRFLNLGIQYCFGKKRG